MERSDRYRIESEISRTRAAAVHRAVEVESGRPVIVKVITAAGGFTDLASRLFLKLASLVRSRRPEALPPLLDFGLVGANEAFLVTEPVEGEPVTPAPAVTTIPLMAQVARSLAVLARDGSAHLNVRPANLLLASATTGQRLRLVGLGTGPLGVAPRSGDPFTAPELRSAPPTPATAGPAADVWALARTTVHLLGGTLTEEAGATPAPSFPPGRLDGVRDSSLLDTVLRRALHRDPGRRPSHGDLHEALLQALIGIVGAEAEDRTQRIFLPGAVGPAPSEAKTPNEPEPPEPGEVAEPEPPAAAPAPPDEPHREPTMAFPVQQPGTPPAPPPPPPAEPEPPPSEPEPVADETPARSPEAPQEHAPAAGEETPEDGTRVLSLRELAVPQEPPPPPPAPRHPRHTPPPPAEPPPSPEPEPTPPPPPPPGPTPSTAGEPEPAVRSAAPTPARPQPEAAPAAPHEARRAAATRGLPGLPFAVDRRVVLAAGGTAVLLVLLIAMVVVLRACGAGREEPPVVPTPTVPAIVLPTRPPVAPTPTPSPAQLALERAEAAAAGGDDRTVATEIATLDEAARAALAPDDLARLEALEAGLEDAGYGQAVGQLRRALERGDLGRLRAAVDALDSRYADRARRSRAVSARLATARRVLELGGTIERAQSAGDHAAALVAATALAEAAPAFELAATARERAARALVAESDRLRDEGRWAEAAERLDQVARSWPDREGLEERRGALSRARDAAAGLARVLEQAEEAERAREPDRGLEILRGATPRPPLVERYREIEQRLEQLLATMDARAPSVRLVEDEVRRFKKNEVALIPLEVTDDYAVREVTAFARREGEPAWTRQPVRRASGSRFELAVEPTFHRGEAIEFYVEARDTGGRVGRLGSPEQPQTLERRRFLGL